MKRPLAAAVMFLYSSVGSVRIDETHSKSTASLDISMIRWRATVRVQSLLRELSYSRRRRSIDGPDGI